MYQLRTGFGFDVHPLVEGLPLVLGGVVIPHHKGATGHSDADTLTHAICDALLGAANMGDIGVHFPDSDPSLKGVDSQLLLRETVRLIASKGYRIGNVDTTVCLQKPKICTWIPQMTETLAASMNIVPDCVSIKATTTERLGFAGREEGVAAYAVVLIHKE
ncbi:MAG: 2-C-methyl-D-erythritol 2,4-cyclodiphosphate synthase [Bacteroidales bacterium]|nr:2-C-methyl-D-erythritol 2,4-cyclodiphosphate synthase [Bacteroidales bacterium]